MIRRTDLEASLRNIVILFFLFLPFEGLLRKWLLPSIQAPLVLLRDPLVLVGVILYSRLSKRAQALLMVWLLGIAILSLYGVIQIIFADASPVAYIFGLRGYLLFIPIAFIFADVFAGKALGRFIEIAMWLAIPSAILAVLQFSSPVDSLLNRTLSDETEGRFLVAADLVRTNGFFTFTLAQSTYIPLTLVLCLIGFLRRKELDLRGSILALGFISTAVMGAVSGSRTFYVFAFIVMAVFATGSAVGSAQGNFVRRVSLLIIMTGFFVVILVYLFPDALTAILERQYDASTSEGSIFDRSWRIVSEFVDMLPVAHSLGAGLGAGTNITSYALYGDTEFRLAEYELSRIVLELGPVAGLIVICARFIAVIVLFYVSLKHLLLRREVAPLIAFSFAGPLLAAAQITGQNQMISFCWLGVGLNLSLLKRRELASPNG